MSDLTIHKVKTICFELDTGTEEQAHRYAGIARDMNMGSLLEKALRGFEDKKEWIRIDRLVIDLGTIDENDNNWSSEIISQIRKQVNRQLQAAGTKKTISLTIGQLNEGEGATLLHKETYKLELLIHYLQTGVLPWYVDEMISMDELLLEIIATDHPGTSFSLSAIFKKQIVRKRLAQVFKESSLYKLFSLYTGSGHWPELRQVLIILKKIIPVQDRQNLIIELHEWMIEAISMKVVEIEKIVSFILRKLSKRMHGIPRKELEQLPAAFKLEFSRTDWIGEDCFTQVLDFLESQVFISSKDNFTEETVPVNKEEKKKLPEDKPATKQKQTDDEESDIEEGIMFIDNAGLVLINAVLLRQGFEKMGWIHNGEFISTQTRNKALQWLQYIVTGETIIHEYQLALNKIICGMEPSDIARIEGELSVNEKTEAGILLNTVIEHWTVIKNTSSDNLRQSFLQRKGRLKQEDGAWHLHVESKAFDILVDKIPWPFSIIKFPWMTKPLYTQWLTRI